MQPRANYTPLAVAIRQAREAAGKPRTQLAYELGVGEASVKRWELGYNLPTTVQAARLLLALPHAAEQLLTLLAAQDAA